MYGSADTAITMDQSADLAKELESAGVAHEIIAYTGAQHALTVFDGNHYQETADRKSWKRFTEFLTDALKNRNELTVRFGNEITIPLDKFLFF